MCASLSACQLTRSEIKAVMGGGKQSFDRPSDRNTERQTSKQTAKPTGRHKGRARGGAKWQLGREMSDFSALWHSCTRLSVKRPPGDSGATTNDKREEQMKWGKCPSIWQFHYQRYLMLMFNIIPHDLNVKMCFVHVEMCVSLFVPWRHHSSCMLKSVFSVFTYSEGSKYSS